MVVSHLSVEQDVTKVSDDAGKFDDLFPAFLKLGCYTVALTDVPAHLSCIEKKKEKRKCFRKSFKTAFLSLQVNKDVFYLHSHVIRFAGCS